MKKIYFFVTLLCAMMMASPIKAQTTTINGLAVVVNYTDYSLTAGLDTLENMLNQGSGFTAWNNNGSVKEYFYDQTAGKFNVLHTVISVTLTNNFNYYHGSGLPYDGGQEFIKDVVAMINTTYSGGFTGLTVRPGEDRLWSFITFSYGPKGIGVAYDTPAAGSILNNGVSLPVRNVSVVNYTTQRPDINVVCHEFGHSIFRWTDYYDAAGSLSSNLGHYCLMGSGGNTGSPMPISAPLRYMEGWIDDVIDITDLSSTQTFSVTANARDQIYKFSNNFNLKEYYLIEALTHSKYYLSLTGDGYVPDQGLAIWYVDEEGGLDAPSSQRSPKIRLVQSNGLDDMKNPAATHRKHRGDDDLFNNIRNIFNDSLYSRFIWKNGVNTGLVITDISAPGATMSFKVNVNNTIIGFIRENGKTVPAGYVNVPTGQSKSFDIVPDFGYELDYLSNSSGSIPLTYSYTFTNVTSSDFLYPNFVRSTSGYALPSPWSHSYIGSGAATGWAGYKSDVFGIEGYGSDIWGSSDEFNFIYRSLSGNGEIVARVANSNKPHDWTKSGIMIRESIAGNSKHVMLVSTPGNGLAPQYRSSTGGGSYHNMGGTSRLDTLKSANWLKITRDGNEFKSYYSYNGTIWNLLETTMISMGTSVYVGLCATAGDATLPVKVQFDNVSVVESSGTSLLSHFGVPRSTGLPSINTNYTHVHVLGSGGPDLSNVTQTQFNWDLSGNSMHQFAFQTNNGVPSWYLSLTGHTTRFLNTSSPGLTINSSTGIANLAGTYYANLDGSNLVLVEQSGAYALYFSNSATPPLRQGAAEFESYTSSVLAFPNPFQDKITVEVPAALENAELVVTNVSGMEIERTVVSGGRATLGSNYAGGLYFVYLKKGEYSSVIKIVKK